MLMVLPWKDWIVDIWVCLNDIVKLPILPHLWKSQEMNYWNSTSELRTEEVSLMSSKTSLNIHPFTHFSTHVIYLNLPVLPMIFFIFLEKIFKMLLFIWFSHPSIGQFQENPMTAWLRSINLIIFNFQIKIIKDH